MFNWFRNKAEDYFTPHQKSVIVAAIKQAEKQTSGEVRVFIESKCSYVNAIDRAKELFEKLDMHKTEERNAVIVVFALIPVPMMVIPTANTPVSMVLTVSVVSEIVPLNVLAISAIRNWVELGLSNTQ